MANVGEAISQETYSGNGYRYQLNGTFSMAISPDGKYLYTQWNDDKENPDYANVALTVVHLE